MNVIISGASSGIGYETVLFFANKGHRVLAISRNKDKLLDLQQQHQNIAILSMDLLDKGLKDGVLSGIKSWEQVDILINNAGQLINKPFKETGREDFLKLYESNVVATVSLIQIAIEKMQKGSHIINITSMGGFLGSSKFPGLSAYSASKGALSILSECLAEEFGELGIAVNALALGAVQTKMLETAFPDYKAPLTAEEMAEYIYDFAVNGNKYFNGKVLPVTLGNP